jgi:hypothetical protein
VQKGDSKSGDRRSHGGLSTKIHIAVDAIGRPLRMILTAGQVHEAGLTLVSPDCR